LKPLKCFVRGLKNTAGFLPESLMSLKKIFVESDTWQGVAFILALALILGTVSNLGLIKKFIAGEFNQAFISKDQFPGLVFISLEEAEDLWFNQKAVFIDSRSGYEYRQGHIPGAISIPLEEAKEKKGELLAIIPRERPLVLYCEGGNCLSSLSLARILHQSGFGNLRIFSGGWKEWTAAGLPVTKESEEQPER